MSALRAASAGKSPRRAKRSRRRNLACELNSAPHFSDEVETKLAVGVTFAKGSITVAAACPVRANEPNTAAAWETAPERSDHNTDATITATAGQKLLGSRGQRQRGQSRAVVLHAAGARTKGARPLGAAARRASLGKSASASTGSSTSPRRPAGVRARPNGGNRCRKLVASGCGAWGPTNRRSARRYPARGIVLCGLRLEAAVAEVVKQPNLRFRDGATQYGVLQLPPKVYGRSDVNVAAEAAL